MNKLLSADPTSLETLIRGTPKELETDLIGFFGEDLARHRVSDLACYASDAGPYRFIPNA